MADKMIFPIGFDLQTAVDEAEKDWDKKYAKRLEDLIAKRPINVKLKLDTSKLDSLDVVKKRLAELKIEPITPETKTAIKELAAELRTLAKALEQVQKYSTGRVTASPDAVRAARIDEINKRKEAKVAVEREKARAAAARAAQAELRLEQARARAATAATRSAEATRRANQEYRNQDGYISRLTKRLIVYAGWERISQFLTGVREVTAEFELQRVSLGAIIQDQTRANALFSEIKSFALKSPVSILDLTKYTKQLAAYKIGVDELFETTKKLTDVSVGLGVSMDRVVLAYGQTRATGYLRASEIRQFTEMGVPIVEELAAKLSKMNGELVTAAQVMDMVSKRAISFELVKEVFDDMTSAGGMFYNMQEKQGNTLFGLWAKLGDAASVMYDEIGNTESVNSAMKGTIQLLTDLMKNWREVGRAILGAAAMFTAFKAGSAIIKMMAVDSVAAAAASRQFTRATIQHRAAVAAANPVMMIHTNMLRRIALWNQKAALSTNLFTVAWNKLKVAMVTWGPMVIAAGIGLIINKIITATENANRLKNTLKEVRNETAVEQGRSVTNFESLARKAVEAAAGSREQKEALDELNRTYKDIIPSQDLTIEKLREMKGDYEQLTVAIKENIRQQQLQKGLSAISEEYGKKIVEARRSLEDTLKKAVFKTEDDALRTLSDSQIKRITDNFEKLINAGGNFNESIKEAFRLEGLEDVFANWREYTSGATYLDKNANQFNKVSEKALGFMDALVALDKETKRFTNDMQESYPELGKFAEKIDEAKKVIASHIYTADENTFAFDKEKADISIKAYLRAFENALKESNVSINISDFITYDTSGVVKDIDWNGLNAILDGIENNFKVPLQNMSKVIRGIFEGFVPTNKTTLALRNKLEEISSQTGVSMDVLKNHLIKSGESWADYSKRVRDAIKGYEAQVEEMQKANAAVFGTYSDDEIKKVGEYAEALKLLLPFLQALTGGRSTQSDQRLSILQEMVSTLKQVNKEYDELAKKEGATKALADTQRVYADTFKNMQQLAAKYKFDLPDFGVPTDTASLTKYLKAVKDAMAKLPKSDKAVLALQVDIEKLNIDEVQKRIDKQLKDLSDKISRTKTAKEFYDKILSQTGDVDVAATLTMNVYGNAGEDLFQQTVEQLQTYFSGVEVDLPINFDTQQIDYKALRKLAERMRTELGEDAYKGVISIADNAEKDMQKMIEGWLKATEKAKTYSDKLADVYRTTATEIERIKKAMAIGDIDKGIGTDLIAGYQRKQAEEIAKLQYEAFKDSPMYVQMFDNLDNASTRMLENMRNRLIAMKGEWKNLDPTQLKELQSRLNEIDAQLAQRNPFKTLANSMREYYKLRKEGDARGNKTRKAADDDVIRWTEAYIKAQEELAKVMADKSASKERIAGAKQMVDYTQRQKEEAEKAAENWKKVEDSIGLSANELMQMLNWAGDIVKAVADISEALGADEEDVQYWNTVADSLTNIAGGIQDIVSAAMSGNVIGVISSVITAIPKMFVGFVNLFNAGRIKKANKEIKYQQELLDQLQYTYSRLEKAAEKVFGADYLRNYNQQLRNLQAQAEAYQKQMEAEKSKGKKADKDKIKEYEDSWRDTLDEIADMQGKLAEKFLGSAEADKARDMAKAYLDAYKQIGRAGAETTKAMKEQFQDMIENMVVEGALAAVMQRALQPMFKMIDEMNEQDFYSESFWKKVAETAEKGATDADKGAQTLMKFLEQAGISIKDISTEYTGIKREVAGATSEEMNANTAALNAQNYYLSQVPGMAVNLAAIRQIMETGTTSAVTTVSAEWTDWQKQAMDSYLAIQRNTADTVAQCRRAADAAESAAAQLQRVITVKGSKHGFQVYM